MGIGIYRHFYGESKSKHSGGMCRVEEDDLVEYVNTNEQPIVEIEHINEIDNSYVMTWGKYRSVSLRRIKMVDPSYLVWLRGCEFVRDNQQWLIQKIDDL
jgi:hypothetical protein